MLLSLLRRLIHQGDHVRAAPTQDAPANASQLIAEKVERIRMLASQGKAEDARIAMASLASAFSDHPDVALCAVNLLWFTGNQRRAFEKGMEECTRFPHHLGLWSQWIQFASALGEHQTLTELAESGAIPHLEDANLQCALGCSYAALGSRNRALVYFEAAVDIDPKHTVALHNLGHTRCSLGLVIDAEAPLRRVIELEPSMAEAHNNLSIVLQRLGRQAEAIASARNALDLEPNNIRFLCQCAALYEHACDWDNLDIVRGKLLPLVDREIDETMACSMPPLLAVSLGLAPSMQMKIAGAFMRSRSGNEHHQ